METGIKERMEHWKLLAEVYLKEDKRVLIKDIDNNWYFADILIVGEDTIEIQCYAPEQRAGQKIVLYWALITCFELAKEDGK
jgi:hypothetical protein